jgi:hypothetical protein
MSGPLDFGWWRTASGQRQLLSWWADSGALTLDGPGGTDVLAVISDEDDLRRRLSGWADHCDTREGLGWLAQRLEGTR